MSCAYRSPVPPFPAHSHTSSLLPPHHEYLSISWSTEGSSGSSSTWYEILKHKNANSMPGLGFALVGHSTYRVWSVCYCLLHRSALSKLGLRMLQQVSEFLRRAWVVEVAAKREDLRRLTLNCEWRRPCSRPISSFTPTAVSSTFVLYPCIQHAHQHADRTRASAKSQVNGILAYLAQGISSVRQSSHRLQAKGCLDRTH